LKTAIPLESDSSDSSPERIANLGISIR